MKLSATTILLILLSVYSMSNYAEEYKLTEEINTQVLALENKTAEIMAELIKGQIEELPLAMQFDQSEQCFQESSLTVGKIKNTITHNDPLPYSIFLVSSDPVSLHWLKRNKSNLMKINALGIPVNIQNKREYENKRTVAGVIPLVCLNIGSIIERYKISHYPVLLTEGRIKQ